MLDLIQLLEFELGTGCNLSQLHPRCPNRHPARYARLDTRRALDDDTIVDTAVAAYRLYGFTGLVGWIYYNEPLLDQERMFRLMAEIRGQVPGARFILWTNGTLLPRDCSRFAQFEQIYISQYDEAPPIDEQLRELARCVPGGGRIKIMPHRQLDDRLERRDPQDPDAPCLRALLEFIVDAYGNVHPCCFDWRGEGTPGNILEEDLHAVLLRWRSALWRIAGDRMMGTAPPTCRACGWRVSRGYQMHDARIAQRCERWRATLTPKSQLPTPNS